MKLYEFFETHHWCQKASATDKDGKVCFSKNQNAVAYCMIGGLNWLCDKYGTFVLYYQSKNKLLSELRKKGYYSIVEFNDTPGRTKQEVINFLKEIDI